MLVEYNGYRSDDSEAVWSHRRRFSGRLVYICTGFGKVVYVSCRRQTSRSGVVALSVMRVWVVFVDIGSKEARLSQNPTLDHSSKHFSLNCRLLFCGLQCRHFTLLN